MGFEMKASVKLEKKTIHRDGYIKRNKDYILYKMARINFTM